MKYLFTEEFKRDLKKLIKRYRTLHEDLTVFQKSSLELFHGKGIPQDIIRIPDTGQDEIQIFKARRFACRSLKGTGSRSGIRIIYSYYTKSDSIEFIEIYFKGDKETEDKKRIKQYIKMRKRT